MQLDKKACGLALGILCGGAMLIATLWVLQVGAGEHLVMLKRFYIGYSISFVGALIGTVYGFVDGFIGGWLFAWLYNKFAS